MRPTTPATNDDLSEHERRLLAESIRIGTTSGSRLSDALEIGFGRGWGVVNALLDRRLLEVADPHWGHLSPSEAARVRHVSLQPPVTPGYAGSRNRASP